MEESYWESMESSIADMLAAGPLQPKAGAITAALFLKHVPTATIFICLLWFILHAAI
jgi:leucyl aminopeptidase